jgi:hypothetical protein
MVGYSLAHDNSFQLGFTGFNLKLRSLSLFDMLKAYAFGFYKVALDLQNLRVHARLSPKGSTVNEIDQGEFEKFLASMKEECGNLTLKHTLNMTLGIEAKYRSKATPGMFSYLDKYTYSDLVNDLDALDISFSSELREELIFRLPSERRDYLEKDDLFGSDVTAAFPSAIDDIRNAGTCFAVEQWDASVFHLMKTLERGLHALAARFGVTFEQANWHNVIEQIEAKVRRMDSSFGADWKEKQKFYSEAASQFMFLKEAWRNYVMHAGDVYDEGKSLSVLSHVREFMQALAKGGLHE